MAWSEVSQKSQEARRTFVIFGSNESVSLVFCVVLTSCCCSTSIYYAKIFFIIYIKSINNIKNFTSINASEISDTLILWS